MYPCARTNYTLLCHWLSCVRPLPIHVTIYMSVIICIYSQTGALSFFLSFTYCSCPRPSYLIANSVHDTHNSQQLLFRVVEILTPQKSEGIHHIHISIPTHQTQRATLYNTLKNKTHG